MRYCIRCNKKNIKGRQNVCPKCVSKKIEGSKSDGQVVYGLYDDDGLLLYVGVTNSVTRRTGEHIEKKIFSRLRPIRIFETRRDADAFEIFAIYHLRPPMNIKVESPTTAFPLSDLSSFGEVSTKNLAIGRKCLELECITVLSKYNHGEYCRSHSPKPRIGGKRVDRRKR